MLQIVAYLGERRGGYPSEANTIDEAQNRFACPGSLREGFGFFPRQRWIHGREYGDGEDCDAGTRGDIEAPRLIIPPSERGRSIAPLSEGR